jgi:hypothetical protein
MGPRGPTGTTTGSAGRAVPAREDFGVDYIVMVEDGDVICSKGPIRGRGIRRGQLAVSRYSRAAWNPH